MTISDQYRRDCEEFERDLDEMIRAKHRQPAPNPALWFGLGLLCAASIGAVMLIVFGLFAP